VVAADLGCFAARKFVLDLLFGIEILFGLRIDTREEDRERIEGVVGAERPSIYEYEFMSDGRASGSERGRREVKGASVR
jgi:hypothetical protein